MLRLQVWTFSCWEAFLKLCRATQRLQGRGGGREEAAGSDHLCKSLCSLERGTKGTALSGLLEPLLLFSFLQVGKKRRVLWICYHRFCSNLVHVDGMLFMVYCQWYYGVTHIGNKAMPEWQASDAEEMAWVHFIRYNVFSVHTSLHV